MNVEQKVDSLLGSYEKTKNDKIHQDIRLRPAKKKDPSYPWYIKLIFFTLILMVVLTVVFYIITPTEAFTYYMIQGLTGFSAVIMYFIKVFGIAIIAVIIVLGLKPFLPVIEFNVKHLDKPEKYYWRPRSYDVYDDIVQIETWHHETMKFNVSNMNKIGNRIYLINEVIKSRQNDESLLLESEQLEVYQSVVDKKKIEFLSEKLAEAYTMNKRIGYHQARSNIINALEHIEETI